MTEELSDLTFFLATNLLFFSGVIGHDVLLPAFFLFAPSPALLELAASHLFLGLFQVSLVEVALLFGLISTKCILSLKEITTVVNVLFDTLPALTIENGLLVQLASSRGFVPLQQAFIQISCLPYVLRVVAMALGIESSRTLLL